jgi:hypothetical protein
MATIDARLVHTARQLINAANVHQASNLILQYELSFRIYSKSENSRIDPAKSERELREWVRSESQKVVQDAFLIEIVCSEITVVSGSQLRFPAALNCDRTITYRASVCRAVGASRQ